MPFKLYILYSASLDKYYVGHTNNLERRLPEHNSGQTKSTRAGKPWKLVYTKEFETKKEAYAEERRIKKMKSRSYIEQLIESARQRVPTLSGRSSRKAGSPQQNSYETSRGHPAKRDHLDNVIQIIHTLLSIT